MPYSKQTFIDGQVLTAAHLNHIEEGISNAENYPVTSVNGKTGNVTVSSPTKTSELTNDSGFITKETDPTVPAWAKAENKPTYTASEVGAAEADHTHTAEDIGAAEADHTHTAEDIGAATSGYTHTLQSLNIIYSETEPSVIDGGIWLQPIS